jgi:NitT/TauT family transport system substrate-binding protein
MNGFTKTILTAALLPMLVGIVMGPCVAWAEDKVTMVTGWTAEAEHGGFYQAHALGFYKKHGLDVTIRQGGPQVNTAQLLAAGAVDFRIGSNDSGDLNYVNSGAPGIAVAGMFQKDPTVLIAHPDVGINTMADMKGRPIALAKANLDTWWPLLKKKYGFTDEQIRPYTFQIAPFLVDKNLVQLGFITSEPYAIKKEAGFDPKVFLVADEGYDTYASIIETKPELVASNPDLVQRFVDASIEGWYSYLYGDPSPGNAEIQAADPTMSSGQIDYARTKLKEYGIIDSGDTTKLGIGAMTDARWKSLFDKLVSYGLYPANMDYKKAFTLQFVDKGHGLDMRK